MGRDVAEPPPCDRGSSKACWRVGSHNSTSPSVPRPVTITCSDNASTTASRDHPYRMTSGEGI